LLRCQSIPPLHTGQRVLYQTVRCGADIWVLDEQTAPAVAGASDDHHQHSAFYLTGSRSETRAAAPRKAIADTCLFLLTAARISRTSRAMPKKPGTNPKGEFAFFNVVYEDGSQRSNRRVPAELLGGLDGDEPARGYIMEQDREIAEKSGRPVLAIKSLSRVGAKKK
jgi:hypothetical protein